MVDFTGTHSFTIYIFLYRHIIFLNIHIHSSKLFYKVILSYLLLFAFGVFSDFMRQNPAPRRDQVPADATFVDWLGSNTTCSRPRLANGSRPAMTQKEGGDSVASSS